jgi:hypothetical protein
LGVVDEGGVGEPGVPAFSVSGDDFETHLARCVSMKTLRIGVEAGEKLEWSLVVNVDEKDVGINGVPRSNFGRIKSTFDSFL